MMCVHEHTASHTASEIPPLSSNLAEQTAFPCGSCHGVNDTQCVRCVSVTEKSYLTVSHLHLTIASLT